MILSTLSRVAALPGDYTKPSFSSSEVAIEAGGNLDRTRLVTFLERSLRVRLSKIRNRPILDGGLAYLEDPNCLKIVSQSRSLSS